MKKLFFMMFLLAFLFCSCANEQNILSYQESNIIANCTINEKFNVNITKNGDYLSLEVLSPATLCGIMFEMTSKGAYAIKDEIKIPLDKDSLRGILALLNSFSLSEDAMTTVSLNNIISFDTDYGLYTVTYGENNLPQNIKILSDAYEYNIIVNTIKLTEATE